jgi:hypothetical protein
MGPLVGGNASRGGRRNCNASGDGLFHAQKPLSSMILFDDYHTLGVYKQNFHLKQEQPGTAAGADTFH